MPSARQAADEPQDVVDTRTSFDAFATEYTEHVRHELDLFALGRAPLAHFAELVSAGGGGPVLEVGCGPGRITAHLRGLGLDVSGLDLSPAMVGIARREHSGLRFEVGTMAALRASSSPAAPGPDGRFRTRRRRQPRAAGRRPRRRRPRRT
ncbi:class I SAM-dependent DNA methyltransferase [Nocardioides sp. MAHUQ-72]|uniref:class I SAM-dependent DNA methyltransferase n=1 Tax=unclassified Nocardioides TaxID=2615069 RepID=UPI003614D207